MDDAAYDGALKLLTDRPERDRELLESRRRAADFMALAVVVMLSVDDRKKLATRWGILAVV